MALVTNFFLGANSGEGFQNLFSQITDLEDTYDLMVLKGGPGVGKNTFMREIGRAMEAAGTPVEYLWCSGDPDSLDGVVLPDLRCAVVDGTSPHVVEPRYPAAVDRYVDLGRFYDLTAAKAAAGEVKTHTHAYQTAYVRAYRNLKAARQVELDAFAAVRCGFDADRARRRVEGILSRELRQKGDQSGRTVRRFLGSVTWQGYVWRFDSVDALCPRVYEFADSAELAGELFAQIRARAAERGWDTIACCAPEEPERIEHLLIPGLGLGFITSRPGMEYGRRPYRRVRLDAMAEQREGRARLRFQTRMAALLREEGIAALREAKASHDALEAVYNPYVDFDGVRTLAALEAGRLLSWL
ncbi:hypothetical protein [Dysosmobacter sp.]|uniref:hypothetical protein n=1 Tax=Dysosmobacter sp. TaxID=2591382 RepID=UPI002A9C420D|nr:hypothetical protein [Dysosmobacter sp.]MCI6053861.1 hypothetical protein [Dysosmobacter sp.]MDY5511163.1 hypothetical protein [Dysosmobacter sp.]